MATRRRPACNEDRTLSYRRQTGSLHQRRLPILADQRPTRLDLTASPAGRFVGASSNPFSEYKRRRAIESDSTGVFPGITRKRAIRQHHLRHQLVGRSFTQARLAVAIAATEDCLSILVIARHAPHSSRRTSTPKITTSNAGRGPTRERNGKRRPEQPDNHRLDCVVGILLRRVDSGGSTVRHRWRIRGGEARAVSFKELQA